MVFQEDGKKAKTWKKNALLYLAFLLLILFGFGLVIMLSSLIQNPNHILHLGFVEYLTVIVSFIIVSTMGIWYYWRFYRTLYHEPEYIVAISNFEPIDNSCIICKRHPVSKKYHIKNVHILQPENVKYYFESCGCTHCKAIPASQY